MYVARNLLEDEHGFVSSSFLSSTGTTPAPGDVKKDTLLLYVQLEICGRFKSTSMYAPCRTINVFTFQCILLNKK